MKVRPSLQLLYLKNDTNQSVEAEEVKQLDLAEIMCHLNRGEAVFISSKCRPKGMPLPSRRDAQVSGTHLQAKVPPPSPFSIS